MLKATKLVKFEEGGFYVGTKFYIQPEIMKLAKTSVSTVFDNVRTGCSLNRERVRSASSRSKFLRSPKMILHGRRGPNRYRKFRPKMTAEEFAVYWTRQTNGGKDRPWYVKQRFFIGSDEMGAMYIVRRCVCREKMCKGWVVQPILEPEFCKPLWKKLSEEKPKSNKGWLPP